jgi:hypothetical protein
VWNEVDPDRRQRMIADTFSDGASYVDPLMASEGHAAIDGMAQAVEARFPGYRFRRAGDGRRTSRSHPLPLGAGHGGGPGRRLGHRLRHGRQRAHDDGDRLYR